MTLMFRVIEFRRAEFDAYVREQPEAMARRARPVGPGARATAEGELDLPREDMLFFATPHENEVSVTARA